jgi:hypothetical protein
METVLDNLFFSFFRLSLEPEIPMSTALEVALRLDIALTKLRSQDAAL